MKHFVVNNPGFQNNGFAFGETIGDTLFGPAELCSECGSFLTMLKWLPPHRIKTINGPIGDLIFGTFSHFLVSDRFKELYLNHNLTGISNFEPVELSKRKDCGKKIFFPSISLSEVKIDIIKSKIKFSEGNSSCSNCQKNGRTITDMKGLILLENPAPEYDIFTTKILPDSVLISEKTLSILKNLENFQAKPSETFIPNFIF